MSVFCVSAAVQKWRSEGRVAVWLHIPILQSRFIAPAASLGFCFHHAELDSSVLSLWLGDGPSRLPGYATHQVGVAGQSHTEDNQNQLSRGLPHFFLQLKVKSLSRVRLFMTPWPIYSPPGSSIHRIFQARTLAWVAIPFTRGSSQPRNWTWVSHIASRLFTIWATLHSCGMNNLIKWLSSNWS